MSYFLKLFTRGRCVTSRSIARREASSKDPQQKHEERERFAVAAIAFCAAHDAKFKRHFLEVVGLKNATTIELIELEPERWGDLVLSGPSDVVIIEFKLDALLAKHQDPRKPLFTKVGYGALINRRYPDEDKRYVVVGKVFDSGVTTDGLKYQGLSWSKFLHREDKESPLEHDLYDCLGVLGAKVFLRRSMKKKSVSKEVAGAMDVYQLLENAAGDIPTAGSESAADHIGLDLSAAGAFEGSLHAVLCKVVRPVGRRLGWIGYEKLDVVCISVWFYPSQNRTKTVRQKLKAARLGALDEDGSSVGIHRPVSEEPDHAAWISRVLKAVTS